MDVGRSKIPETFPDQLPVWIHFEEPDLYVVLLNFVTKQIDLLSSSRASGAPIHPADL